MLLGAVKLLILTFVVEVKSVDKFLRGQSLLYGLSSLTENINRTTVCFDQLHRLYQETDLNHFWALKVIDASGQPGTGFLWGNNLWIGSHFQCVDASNRKLFEINYNKVEHPNSTPYDFPPYEMVFAMAYMRHNSTHQHHTQMPIENLIQLGLCIPNSCSVQEIQFLLQTYLDEGFLNIQQRYDLNIEIEEIKLIKDESWLSMPKTIFTLVILISSVALVIIGTIYDVNVTQPYRRLQNYQKQINLGNRFSTTTIISTISNLSNNNDIKPENKCDVSSRTMHFDANPVHVPGTVGQILQCFSLYSNTKALVKTKISTDSIPAIHGVRLFSILWVISVHAVYYQIDYLKNVATGFRLSEKFIVQILGNSTYCVDSFLFLSGFLISYTFYKSKNGIIACKRPINVMYKISEVLTMFVHRYLRLTPVYLITILISDMLFTYYRQTTSLYTTEQADINCPKYWWRNLLYINNFYPRSEMCLSWSWYLSADTQFFLVASILLILSTIVLRTSFTVLTILIVACMTITGYRSYAIGYIPTMDEQFIQLDAIYDFPWNRIGPYLVGVVVGYVLVVILKGKLELKKPYLVLCWILFPLVNLWILFMLYGRQISVEFSAFYMGTSRTLWGFGLGWLFVACCTGNGGIVSKFLSFPGWIPLSRLTYCCYLINPLMINLVYMGAETAQDSSIAGFTLAIFGHTLLTFFVAYFYSIVFESPYILLTKMLFKKLVKPKSKTNIPA